MKLVILTAAAVVAMCSISAAADRLVTDVSAEAPAAEASSINGYVQLMGGWTMPNTLADYWSGYSARDLAAGWSLGAKLGIETPIDGVSLEIDVLHSMVEHSLVPAQLNSTSLMANAVYSIDLNDVFSLYGGAGLGIIAVDYSIFSFTSSGTGAGYQVLAGVQAAVAENVALTLETRYQSSVDNITMEWSGGDYEQQFNRTSILTGVLFSF